MYGFFANYSRRVIMQNTSPSSFSIYDGGTEIRVLPPPAPSETTAPIRSVLATASLDRHLFLVSQAHDLFAGYVDIGADSVAVRCLRRGDVRDVHCSAYDARVYVVCTDGAVHHLAAHRDNCLDTVKCGAADNVENRMSTDDDWTELVITSDRRARVQRCPHGVPRSPSDRSVRMLAVTGNAEGVLFTSVHGELYGMGRFGALLPPGVTTSMPHMFECFRGLCVRQAVAGEQFVLVLTAAAERSESAATNGDGVATSSSDTSLSTDDSHSEVVGNGDETVCRECSQCNGSQCSAGTADELPVAFELCNVRSISAHSLNSVADDPVERANTIKRMLSGAGIHSSLVLRNGAQRLTRRLSNGSETVDNSRAAAEDEHDATETKDTDIDGTDTSSLYSMATVADIADDGHPVNGSTTMTSTSSKPTTTSCSTTMADQCRLGESQLGTSVWSFGAVSAQNGADVPAATKSASSTRLITQVLGLSGLGVCAIRSGAAHWAARTLDGRLYVWGGDDNATDTQLNIRPRLMQQQPQQQLDNVLDVACGRNSIAVLTNRLQLQVRTLGASGGVNAPATVVVWPYRKSRDVAQPEPGALLLGTAEFSVQNAARPALKHIELHFTA